MNCPVCDVKWNSIIGASATTMVCGTCCNCGEYIVVDTVQLTREINKETK